MITNCSNVLRRLGDATSIILYLVGWHSFYLDSLANKPQQIDANGDEELPRTGSNNTEGREMIRMHARRHSYTSTGPLARPQREIGQPLPRQSPTEVLYICC